LSVGSRLCACTTPTLQCRFEGADQRTPRPALNNHGWEGESMEGTWRVARRTRDGLRVATARRSRYRHSGLGDGEWAAQQVSVGTRLLVFVVAAACTTTTRSFASLPFHDTARTRLTSFPHVLIVTGAEVARWPRGSQCSRRAGAHTARKGKTTPSTR
jgi:hypothetical protein